MREIDIARLKKARESRLEVGAFAFVIRRPTVAEIAKLRRAAVDLEFTTQFVVGWEGVNESDLIPGGDPEPVAFNAEVFRLWIQDRPDLWGPISKEVIESYKRYEATLAERGNA